MISAVLIVKNEAQKIEACLTALNQVVDEIIVVDHGSEDATRSISEKLGARVFEKEWEGYASGKNYGNKQATQPWILSIDADEVLSDELINTLKTVELTDDKKVFALDRANHFAGVWVKHCGWYPDWKVRLFPRNKANWEGDFVHERLRFLEKMTAEKLPGKLLHYSYDSDEDHFERMDRYAQLAAEKLIDAGKNPGWLKQQISPLWRVFKTYIIKKGFLDGALGWKLSRRTATLMRWKFRKFRELKNRQQS